MGRSYYQGKYTPRNPRKYRGDVNNIVYRSSWELKFMNWCDTNPSVIEWGSEEVIVPYICHTDGKPHRYFVDFNIKVKDRCGNVKEYLIEIKPFAETQPPKEPKRKTERYKKSWLTFAKNQAKWKAAESYAKNRNKGFIVLTERELYPKGKP